MRAHQTHLEELDSVLLGEASECVPEQSAELGCRDEEIVRHSPTDHVLEVRTMLSARLLSHGGIRAVARAAVADRSARNRGGGSCGQREQNAGALELHGLRTQCSASLRGVQ